MTPYEHSELSVRDFGGKYEDYVELHKFLDSTKFHLTDFRHRAILHNTFGIGLCEKLFGDYITNSEGNNISVREVARRHIMQDSGVVPTIKETLDALSNGDYHKFNKPLKRDLKWLKENLYLNT
jgi:hypothetical protein